MEHFNIKIVDSVDMNWSPNSTRGTAAPGHKCEFEELACENGDSSP